MRKSGFTLIEVVIALFIFVVGALAVIRIFPPAYNVVQNSSYRNIATRLSDSILAQMKGDGSTPDAVFDININSPGGWASNVVEASWPNPDPDVAVVGTSNTNGSLPDGASPNAYTASALNHFKYIRGESHYIQNSAGNDSASNAPYLLTNFPYT
ncbi:MAG: prepilin-type N-terminal cleavage/methylation domain-containing protein, partial [Abditibacteriaceae bacterium]